MLEADKETEFKKKKKDFYARGRLKRKQGHSYPVYTS